jgi:hypothetical protein
MSGKHARLRREEKTIRAMIGIYCHGNHGTKGLLCSDCDELLSYAMARLAKCPFQEAKTTCAQCPVHCYKPIMRAMVRDVMRYAGPRMTFSHPILAFFHFVDGFRKLGKGSPPAR